MGSVQHRSSGIRALAVAACVTSLLTSTMVPAVGCSASRGTRVTRTRLEAPPSSAPEADRSVALDRVVRLAGATYDISVRSRDSRHPVLLFLEDAQASRAVGSEQWRGGLEGTFVVVRAAERYPDDGAGLELQVARVMELIDWTRGQLGVDRVVLAAHSQRSVAAILAAKRSPDRLYAYVGVGQVLKARDGLAAAGRLGSSAVAAAPVSGVDVAAEVQSLDVPVFFIAGRGGSEAGNQTAAEFHAGLDARQGKTLVWFDGIGWAPHLEQPARFVELMVGRVRAVTQAEVL